MSNAYDVANLLYDAFCEKRMFKSSCRVSVSGGIMTSASAGNANVEDIISSDGFANIAVQAIGVAQNEGCVYVYSSRGTAKALSKLERNSGDITIRVRRLTPIHIKARMTLSSTNRPNIYVLNDGHIACGSSCGLSYEQRSGTFGAIVRKDGREFILSNNHVIGGCNHANKKAPVVSPSSADSVINIPPSTIGYLRHIIPLESGNPEFVEPCLVDAALADVNDLELLSSWQGDASRGYDTPTRICKLHDGMLVKKTGRTTGLTHGIVESHVHLPFGVEYDCDDFKATVYFKDYWNVKGCGGDFALQGDSGSLVVSEDGRSAVGLLFAVSSSYGCIIPIQNVLDAFGGGELVGGHNIPAS